VEHRKIYTVGTSIARPRLRSKQLPEAIPPVGIGICLWQIAFVPNAGQAMLVPTSRFVCDTILRVAALNTFRFAEEKRLRRRGRRREDSARPAVCFSVVAAQVRGHGVKRFL
jgi:hypothetical protein